ncbi:hypothetical protein [Kordiimonas aquimaris]|uniref:hypothetical protein n=1 Tax=Kordiimonas aquimaris TaxID=707591 RepID=UPI0021CFE909|nr:hypothetical protein [Kordiimonas aquimaris]
MSKKEGEINFAHTVIELEIRVGLLERMLIASGRGGTITQDDINKMRDEAKQQVAAKYPGLEIK